MTNAAKEACAELGRQVKAVLSWRRTPGRPRTPGALGWPGTPRKPRRSRKPGWRLGSSGVRRIGAIVLTAWLSLGLGALAWGQETARSLDEAINRVVGGLGPALWEKMGASDAPLSITIVAVQDEDTQFTCAPLADPIATALQAELLGTLRRTGGKFRIEIGQNMKPGSVIIRASYAKRGDALVIRSTAIEQTERGVVLAVETQNATISSLNAQQQECVDMTFQFGTFTCVARAKMPIYGGPRTLRQTATLWEGDLFRPIASFSNDRKVLIQVEGDQPSDHRMHRGFINMRRDELARSPRIECANVPRGQFGGRPVRVEHKSILEDCAGCPTLIALSPMRHRFGSETWETGRDADETPAEFIEPARGFAIGQAEVTAANWSACVDAGVCDARSASLPEDAPIPLSWREASEYLGWLTQATGYVYRFPTEAEWEYAARAASTTRYWWGDVLKRNHSVCRNCISPPPDSPLPVTGRRPNGFGLYDVAGNLWEWVSDCGHRDSDGVCTRHYVKGGSFADNALTMRAANRNTAPMHDRFSAIGLRVARDLY